MNPASVELVRTSIKYRKKRDRMIESMNNAQVKRIVKLKKSSRFRRQERVFIVEGFKMAEEGLIHGLVQTMYVAESAGEEYFSKLSHTIGKENIEWVSDAVFRQFSDTASPQGVLAVVRMPEYDREKMLAEEGAALVCLEDIQDPGNLGTIIRTAEGAGMSGVVLSRGCVDLFNPKVVRSTMGALYRMPYYITEDLSTEVECLKRRGFQMAAARLDAELDFTHADYRGKTGLLIGNEARGLCSETTEKADVGVKIPMEGQLESLNAAVSAALLMYEIHRQRGQ